MALRARIRPTAKSYTILLALCVLGFGSIFILSHWTSGTDTRRVSVTTPLDKFRQTFNDVYSTYYDTSSSMLLEHDKDKIIRRRFEKRKTRLQQKCSILSPNFNGSECVTKQLINNILYVSDRDIAFCAIQKTGSTFWKKILHAAGGKGGNVFSVEAKHVDNTADGGFERLYRQNVTTVIKTVHKSTSFLFVRDPFTRAFSGWYDKFYSPNAYYWKAEGRRIIRSERQGATDTSLQCGCDVTFPEFVQYLVRALQNSDSCFDGHFSSSFGHCYPCTIGYDFIGKFETIKQDTEFLISNFNISKKVVLPVDDSHSALADFSDASDFIFRNKQDLTKSVSFRCALIRLWRRFQGRGIIDDRVHLPIDSDQKAEHLTRDGFRDLLLEAYHNSNHDRAMNNRNEALSQAFSTLSAELLLKFRNIFKLDFELFDYSQAAPTFSSQSGVDFLEPCV